MANRFPLIVNPSLNQIQELPVGDDLDLALSSIVNAVDLGLASDEKLKQNIKDIENHNVIDNMRPVEFNWKTNGKKSYGLIAQEVEKILPEIVSEDDITGNKSVSYIQLVPFLLQYVKELKKEIEELKQNTK